MSLRISNITLSLDSNEDKLVKKAARILGISPLAIKNLEIVKKAVDARNKKNVFFVYTVDVEVEKPEQYLHVKNTAIVEKIIYQAPKSPVGKTRPVIIGAGPAGLFAALILSEAGLNPIIIEQGAPVDWRVSHVNGFWDKGQLNPSSNVQFGEGGAGTFSDGKLTTGIKDFRIQKIMDELVNLGAPAEIKYNAKPHIGTDKLVGILINMRKKIESLGGEYRFNTRLTDIDIECRCINSITVEDLLTGKESHMPVNTLILALGHSARDTFEMLEKKGVPMEAKAFSVGVRIEHKQSFINKSQYGDFWNHPKLGAADYKLNVKAKGRGVYTFCMCPGGQVIGASSEAGRLVINGMSRYARDSKNANSAILVSVSPSDFKGDSPLRGMYFQRELEERAFKLGGGSYFAPVQLLGDFLNQKKSTALGDITPSYKPGYKLTDLRECLPDFVYEPLKDALIQMGKKIKKFDNYDNLLTAVESRSSSPVKIIRDETCNSEVFGLFPCGEGAGYAGGIMSACVDGIKCAESLIKFVDIHGFNK
ncbi:MAG: FAD-dependent oxidoreductase [Defluviitaleaceae bacterium]|nr:FAD-dependent oxidoreductase [Defluviitaleaceae bacterium]